MYDIIIPRIISHDERFAVIECWLNGESREDIAKKQNIGSSTVFNIIREWANGIGVQRADILRV
jgi:transposase